jgi:predicted nucleic acid-binding protein
MRRMPDKILVDTSAFYALNSVANQFHQRATGLYASLIDQRSTLYTTSYILVECMALIHRRLGFAQLGRFVNSVRDSVTVVWLDGQHHWAAWDLMNSRQGRRLSFVDFTTVVLANALNAKVFAFDDDFAREGLELV